MLALIPNPRGFATNDVDYLTSARSENDTASPTTFTPADMQLFFIKNLAATLIQRVHSMDRFSEDDYALGASSFMPWDIVFDRAVKVFGVVTDTHTDDTVSAVWLPARDFGLGNNNWHIDSLKGRASQTITEADLPAFRAALEACYAQ